MLIWTQILFHVLGVQSEDLRYLFFVQLRAVLCSSSICRQRCPHGGECVPTAYVNTCVTWAPDRAILWTFWIVEEDGREHFFHAVVHTGCQSGLILQRCQQQFFRLWILEGNLAEELIDNGIDHHLVGWEFLGRQLRCPSILAVL